MTLVSSRKSRHYHAGFQRDGKWFSVCGHTTPRQRLRPVDSSGSLAPCSDCPLGNRPPPVVYFAKATKDGRFGVKIGSTRDVNRRLAQLSCKGGPLRDVELIGTISGGKDVEFLVHRHFNAERWGRSEMFTMSDRLAETVRQWCNDDTDNLGGAA
jgi:hypothetical protein